MYLGLRDIAAARGRFSLITSVVALITLLLVMLTGLTGGLADQNTSALKALGPDRFVFGGEVSFTSSSITPQDEKAWQDALGASSVVPLGVASTRLQVPGDGPDARAAVTLMGLPAGPAVPGGEVPARGVLLPDELGGTADTVHLNHQPVAWADMDTWARMTGADGPSSPTVLMVSGDGPGGAVDDDRFDAVAEATGTTAVGVEDSFAGLPAYQSERGSLLAIQGLLYGISALVVVAFLSVWTIQRTRDIAVLRALGASTGYVVADAAVQAAVILAVGVVGGAALGGVLGALAAGTVPFAVSAATFLLPPVGVFVLGMGGALVAMRRVSTVDPHLALGASA
ncbi:ABC transporter permease [Corynebacterium sp.]|uniref:ABC transporter permease n=1 Tax=Corynebacterium sp. TaxID=1720 RepID=UPI0026481926|nr:ABC transporter permease [Corynebacterium sp.]MDN5721090.1 ABC transporter permease [Corynebacterium sp.]